MREKVWIMISAVLLFVFVSWPCVAEEQKRNEKAVPAKPAPHPQATPQPQARPNAPQPQQRPGGQQVKPGTPGQPGIQQVKPGTPGQSGIQQVKPGTPGQPVRPGAGPAGSTVRQGAPGTVHQPGQSHPVDRAELGRKLRASVTREAQQRAVSNYRVERVRFTRNVPPMRFAPVHRVVLKRMRIIPGTYYYRRGVFYDAYGYVPPPYIYTMYPRYGLWDAVFLGFMLERAAEQEYALMYYNHRNEAEMIQWRQDMDRMAMDNADLRAKLAAMDQQAAQLQGTPVDSAYVPQDAQDVALSPDVIDQLTAAK